MKNVVECYKHFFGYFNALETHDVGIFGHTISTVSPLSIFSINFNHYFNKKLSLYIHIPNIHLELGFEFEPQRIKDLAFVRP